MKTSQASVDCQSSHGRPQTMRKEMDQRGIVVFEMSNKQKIMRRDSEHAIRRNDGWNSLAKKDERQSEALSKQQHRVPFHSWILARISASRKR